MATIIDTSFFYADLQIPQITEASVNAEVVKFIEKYEPLYLQDLLGYALYKAFKTDPAAARFANLISGGDFIDASGVLRPFVSVKQPIANYVYFYYMRHNITRSTGTGEKILKNNVSQDMSPFQKLVKSWNEMVDWSWELIYYVDSNQVTFPEYKRGYYSRIRNKINILF